MPDEEKKMVDIDTSGPEVDVELETQAEESEVSIPQEKEKVTEVTSPSPQEASDEKQETKTEEATEEKKDELETYSKDVQRRIAKLTKKWREAERQKEEALQFARIQKDTADKLSKKYSSLETNTLKTKETQIASALQGAKARLAQAREAGDINAEVDIQKDISRLGYEEARLLEMKAAQEEMVSQKEETIPTMQNVNIPRQPNTVVPDERAENWGAKNRWFGTDKPMTYTAFDIHETLVNEEGYDPSSDEYYSELDKRIRVAFPTKFANNETIITAESTKPTQIVASAKRSVKPGRKTVRLTPSQVAIAKKLGVPLEEYAKQIKIMKEV
jgi:hypothetical protein